MGSRRPGALIARLLQGCGLGLALAAMGLQLVAWTQTTAYRQVGVRAPWVKDALETAAPAAAQPVLPPWLALGRDGRLAAEDRPGSAAPAGAPVLGGGAPPLPSPEAPAPPRQLRIPAIGVDSPVVELGITDSGEWELPTIEVGWYRHTAAPRTSGNAVLMAHLNDSWGLPRVFARLRDVRLGDSVEVESAAPSAPAGAPARLVRYIVSEKRLVPSTAVEVMDPTADARLTLFTCGGAWDFLRGEYSHRQLLVAHPAAVR